MMIAAIISLRCSARHARLDTTQLRINGTIGACVAKCACKSVREFIDLHRQSGEHESERARSLLQLLDRRRRLKRRAHFTTWLTSLSENARVTTTTATRTTTATGRVIARRLA